MVSSGVPFLLNSHSQGMLQPQLGAAGLYFVLLFFTLHILKIKLFFPC